MVSIQIMNFIGGGLDIPTKFNEDGSARRRIEVIDVVAG